MIDLIKARILCDNFRFIDDLSSISESGYFDVYPEKLELGKKILMKKMPVFWI